MAHYQGQVQSQAGCFHQISACERASSSASVVDVVTVVWRAAFQSTGPPKNLKIHPSARFLIVSVTSGFENLGCRCARIFNRQMFVSSKSNGLLLRGGEECSGTGVGSGVGAVEEDYCGKTRIPRDHP